MKPIYTLLFAIGIGMLAACSAGTTELTASKTFPENMDAENPTRILVVGVSDNSSVRNLFEKETAARLEKQGIHAVRSMQEMPADVKIEKGVFDQYFSEEDIDAVLVTHVVDHDKLAIHAEGDEYGLAGQQHLNIFYDYYYYMYDRTAEPGHFETAEILRMESTLYSVHSRNAVWSCISKSFHQANTEKILDDLSKLLVKAMEQDGVI